MCENILARRAVSPHCSDVHCASHSSTPVSHTYLCELRVYFDPVRVSDSWNSGKMSQVCRVEFYLVSFNFG